MQPDASAPLAAEKCLDQLPRILQRQQFLFRRIWQLANYLNSHVPKAILALFCATLIQHIAPLKQNLLASPVAAKYHILLNWQLTVPQIVEMFSSDGQQAIGLYEGSTPQ